MTRIALIVIVSTFILIAPESGAITVSLDKIVFYKGTAVALRDFVSLGDCNGETADLILSQTLGVKAGILSIIPQRIIRNMVTPNTNDPVVMTGNRVFLVPDSATDSEKRFFGFLLDFLDNESGSKDSRMEIEVSDRVSNAYSESGEQPSLRFWNRKTKLGYPEGTMRIEYTFKSTGMTERIEVAIRSYVPVLKATKAISRHEALGWNKLAVAEEEVSSLEYEEFHPDAKVEDFSASSKIPAGSFVYSRQVERMFDVKSRDQVTLVFHRGAIRLTMTGTASESGSMGDLVTVKPQDGDKSFVGKITGTREVTVDVSAN